MPVTSTLAAPSGSRATGFGVVDVGRDGPRYVASGAIRASGADFPRRLQEIYAGVAALVAEYAPGEIAIERVFVNRNPDSALKLGQARGAALSATFGCAASIHEYTPRAVKLGVVGNGAAENVQVQRMVAVLLGLELQRAAGLEVGVAPRLDVGQGARAALQLGVQPR